jgi:hypothetical protein
MPDHTSRRPVAGRLTALLTITLIAVACSNTNSSPPVSTIPPSAGPGSSPTASPSAAPSSGPVVGTIDHPTGATDVVLRIESGGGFVPMDFLATQAPSFTLYGNGVIVFQRTVTVFPQPDANGVTKGIPWRTASLDEAQIQELLEFALGPGGLGAARDSYIDAGIADAPDTIFTVHAGGIDKTVLVNALSEETRPGPDAVARTAFSKLAKRLQDFDQGGTIGSDVYAPDRFRGVLIEREPQPGLTPLDWPWTTIQFADFKEGPDGSGPTTFPHRTLTPDDLSALKLTDIEGGIQGLAIKAPSGKLYSLIVRPLLADERE